jgi:hypothetical protein
LDIECDLGLDVLERSGLGREPNDAATLHANLWLSVARLSVVFIGQLISLAPVEFFAATDTYAPDVVDPSLIMLVAGSMAEALTWQDSVCARHVVRQWERVLPLLPSVLGRAGAVATGGVNPAHALWTGAAARFFQTGIEAICLGAQFLASMESELLKCLLEMYVTLVLPVAHPSSAASGLARPPLCDGPRRVLASIASPVTAPQAMADFEARLIDAQCTDKRRKALFKELLQGTVTQGLMC